MGAFIGLYFLNFTLNTFTLLGLTLAIGIVVDDAIMVLENIFRYNEKGLDKIESAIIGAREITFAAIAATAAIIAIFLPVVFMKGVIGKFFLQYGVTISLAVLISLLESLTITPMRCSSFVHTGERKTLLGRSFEKLMEQGKIFYGKSLVVTLNHRWKILLTSLLFVVASFYLVGFLNKELTPVQDQSLFILRLMTPIGSSLAFTNSKAQAVEQWLRQRPEIAHVYVAVGGLGTGGGSDTNTGMMFVTMKDKDQRSLSQQQFMAVARKELAQIQDLKTFMLDLSSRGFSTGRGYPIEFALQGPDWDKLAELDESMKKSMRDSGLMVDVDSDYREGMPEIQILPDRTRAAFRGVSMDALGNTVNALIGGVKNGQYTKNGHRYDIYVQLEKVPDPRKELSQLLIGNARNNLIPISQVSKIQQKLSLQQISRANRQRSITLYANLVPGASQQAALDFIKKKSKELPPTYFIEQSGAAKAFQESFQSLILAFALGLFVAYIVLASQFNSFLDPFAVLMALPFSFSGAFFALFLTNNTLNMYSMIGLLLLMGIVKKNSILLIDFTKKVRDREKKNAAEALLVAGPIRLRPIIMTSFATIAAAIPSALGTGAGSETFRPMALTLIGGVFVSTLLTLYIVPITYSLLDRFQRQSHRKEVVKEAFEHVDKTALER
jgi:HAE1 family hydrophobic/amphiphilic exporter-1